MHLWYQFQNPTLLCSLLHLQVFQKNLTSDLYDEVTEIQISLKLLQIPLWYQFQTPMLPCSRILANLHLHVAHWPRRVMMLFSKNN